ncbi:FAD-dependent oxidoreductase [Clostridium boliviensis]|uniref:FAD-dependent oxidoreductase n=1 Tax=Clostridium boliviensis TaxID=318465 RepID=A0ABU4GFH5_9CLOT|nr:FAD-dependent oxidoreductase [Clostridium boliviensis]MDW2796369.1 FAD-dependent oxidoreductase [Clostridium boliviensis]
MEIDHEYQGKRDYPNLFSPIRIGNIRLKNRIIAAPTSPSMITADGHITPEMTAYLEEKARGGVSVVTYGEAIVHSATGKSHNKQLQLDSFGVKQGLAQTARAIHNAGAYANIQLSHGGKYGGLSSVGGDQQCCVTAYGPSAEVTPMGEVKEMPKEMIYEIIDSYKTSARLCKDCGFDMVMVHAAHGWLFSQFLSPAQNRRTDEFGGSLENRARFLLMTLNAVREGVGPGFPIEIRISGDDLTDTGLGLPDCIQVAKMADDKVDLFNISCGNHEDPDVFCRTHPSAFYERGVNVYLAAEIKKHVKTPVACVGSLNDPAQMEKIIASGQADLVELGRALLADPYLPKKALAGNAEDITPCLRCYECFGETSKCETVKCTVNPTMGQQLSSKFIPPQPERVKKVLIAGGGPAGMQAAVTAAKRGHEVILAEKADQLGGNLHAAGAAYFKKDIHDYLQVLKRRVERSGVRVELNTEVTESYIKELSPDALIVALGSKQWVPSIPGIDLPHVIMAAEAELHPEQIGTRVVIMGGGLVGSEAAISLHSKGCRCTIIEMKPAVAEDVNSFYRGGLMPEVKKAAVIHVNTRVKEIIPKGVICEKQGKTFIKEADSVLCAMGFRSPYEEVDRLCESVGEYYIVGDCKNTGQIYQAVNDAYYAALLL